ncbi:CD82 antigen [Sigmodon hispidus]
MGAACIKITKYFLFLFNLLFFILGAVILGFGVWILADKNSFISVLQTSSNSVQIGAYVFISVGAITMFLGLLGCVGAVNEVRCLLGLYFVFLLLILIAQVTVGVLFYFNAGKLKQEVGERVLNIIRNYTVNASSSHEESLQEVWDYVQAQVKCCGWDSFYNWTENLEIQNSPEPLYPCSCEITGEEDNQRIVKKGFCKVSNSTQNQTLPEEWPVYQEGCMKKVEAWLQENFGILLGVCIGVAVIELLGLLLSICLCRHIHSEDYSKVPKY